MLETLLDEAYALYFLIKSPQGDEGRGGHHLDPNVCAQRRGL